MGRKNGGLAHSTEKFIAVDQKKTGREGVDRLPGGTDQGRGGGRLKRRGGGSSRTRKKSLKRTKGELPW